MFFTSGGTGARATKDGLSATAFPSGVLGTPVEVIETLSPLFIERKGLRDGSGGDGRFRGGLGQVITFRVETREPYVCSVLCDRTRTPAQGFFGGMPGAPGEVLINGRPPANPEGRADARPGQRRRGPHPRGRRVRRARRARRGAAQPRLVGGVRPLTAA